MKLQIEPQYKLEITQCRCCGLTKPNSKMKSLTATLNLDSELFALPSPFLIVDLFTYCTKQTVDLHDQMPSLVCCSCVRKLIETYEFLKTCEKGLQTFAGQKADDMMDCAVEKSTNHYKTVELGVTPEAATRTTLTTWNRTQNPQIQVRSDAALKTVAQTRLLSKETSTESLQTDNAIDDPWMRFTSLQTPTKEGAKVQNISKGLVPFNFNAAFGSEKFTESVHGANSVESDSLFDPFDVLQPPLPEDSPGLRLGNSFVSCLFCKAVVSYKQYVAHFENSHKQELPDDMAAEATFIECNECNVDLEFKDYKVHYERQHKSKFEARYVPCPICLVRYLPEEIEEHMDQQHKVVRNFMCDRAHCGEKFFLEESLQWHLKTEHGEKEVVEKPLEDICHICGSEFTSRKKYTKHMMAHKEKKTEPCPICDILIQKTNRAAHLRTHTGEKSYSCGVCEKRFGSCSAMRLHEKKHWEQKPFTCNLCDQSFAKVSLLREHMRSHTTERPYACHLCDKAFQKKTNLVDHLRVHVDEKPFACDECPKRFGVKELLRKHKYTHRPKGLECDECGERFTFPTSLYKHSLEEHGIDLRPESILPNNKVTRRIADRDILRLDPVPLEIFEKR